MNQFLENPYIMAVVKISIIMAILFSNFEHQSITTLANSSVFKILLLISIVFVSNYDVQLALLLALLYVSVHFKLSGKGLIEPFVSLKSFVKSDDNLVLIEPLHQIYPGCLNITLNDIISSFNGNTHELNKAVQVSYQDILSQIQTRSEQEKFMKLAYAVGLPHNVQLNDKNAPLIATLLVYAGFHLSPTCKF